MFSLVQVWTYSVWNRSETFSKEKDGPSIQEERARKEKKLGQE